jgi:hypothetical protein
MFARLRSVTSRQRVQNRSGYLDQAKLRLLGIRMLPRVACDRHSDHLDRRFGVPAGGSHPGMRPVRERLPGRS